jgi:glycerol-3-phosphate cytidylyltransferase-like family protein
VDVVDAYVLEPNILEKYEADFIIHGDDIILD